MDTHSFTFSFPISGDSSAPLWNAEPESSLVPFPSDLSFSSDISDPNILLSRIPKVEPPLSPSYSHTLPSLRSFSPSYTHCLLIPPPLRSFESYSTKLEPLSPSYTHRFPQNIPSFETPTSLDSYFTNLISAESNNHQTLQPVVVRRNNSSKRKRSQRIGDKYRSLKKLMPLDKRMDTSTMLGEAYKYVKFLQAQLKVVQNMPDAESGFRSQDGALGSVFGALGELSRNELLQVVLNSPEAHNMLCSEGSCVFSIEQLMS
ncbi:basic helix-loop-helix (bHLH) DNA-binding superfamily protein [Euphorbia peplus]|nr:basic helix-loop-helix (bHLH) DNA-binding superfamily protein [Euphorbia peplus]